MRIMSHNSYSAKCRREHYTGYAYFHWRISIGNGGYYIYFLWKFQWKHYTIETLPVEQSGENLPSRSRIAARIEEIWPTGRTKGEWDPIKWTDRPYRIYEIVPPGTCDSPLILCPLLMPAYTPSLYCPLCSCCSRSILCLCVSALFP